MILISYSRWVEYTRKNPLKLKRLANHSKRIQHIALKLLQTAPVSHFLELKTSAADKHATVRVKKLVLEPKLLEEAI
jgi:hypothetical protein